MDTRKAVWSAALIGSLISFGCGHAGDGSRQAGAEPRDVIGQFLEAIRVGDDDKASGLLTPLARQKTAEMQMVVAPPGSETARYQVLETRLDAEQARVESDWTDLDTDGRPHTDRIVWILHKDAGSWRIAGMSTRVFADQDPIVLDFEDPADMLRKQQQAEEEIARRDRQSPPAIGGHDAATLPTVR